MNDFIYIIGFTKGNRIIISNSQRDAVKTMRRIAPEIASAKNCDLILSLFEAKRRCILKNSSRNPRLTINGIDMIQIMHIHPQIKAYPVILFRGPISNLLGGHTSSDTISKIYELTESLKCNQNSLHIAPACESGVIRNDNAKSTMLTVVNASRFANESNLTQVVNYDAIDSFNERTQ